MLIIPDFLHDIYPNPVRMIGDTPVVVFRDHRWTLPIITLAAQQGILPLPACVIGFDRHPDALEPSCGTGPLAAYRHNGGRSPDALVPIVRDRLSPRDDDWVRAGMELGIIGDMAGFGSDPGENDDGMTVHFDMDGVEHRLYRLRRPHFELSFKGALTDSAHPMALNNLWSRMGWEWIGRRFMPSAGTYVLDLDLDYWTISWDTYTFPFPPDVFVGEFGAECQSAGIEPWPVMSFFESLLAGAALVTITTEPNFCGGAGHARTILEYIDRHLFAGGLDAGDIAVDYCPVYPDA